MSRDHLSDDALWQRIDACDLTGLGEGAFFGKLTKENRWSRGTARAAIREYKKFMYLATLSDDRLSPPPIVDRVWHVHLVFTRHYWGVFCPEVLGKTIHHEPSPPTSKARRRDKADGKLARELYATEFGGKPPRGVWSPTFFNRLTPVLGFLAFGAFALAAMQILAWWIALSLFGATFLSGLLSNGTGGFSLTVGTEGGLFTETHCGTCGSSGDGCGDGGGCGD